MSGVPRRLPEHLRGAVASPSRVPPPREPLGVLCRGPVVIVGRRGRARPLVAHPRVRASRASSFGGVAAHYARYRPGPPDAAVEWILSGRVGTVVDLGAGTGGLSRVLLGHADHVVAVEPDDRMRRILEERVPRVRTVPGRGEAMPLPDRSADAVVAASSWHWMDPLSTLTEVGRVLVPGGALGALWSGQIRGSLP